jgi:hypothetical protein
MHYHTLEAFKSDKHSLSYDRGCEFSPDQPGRDTLQEYSCTKRDWRAQQTQKLLSRRLLT